ncbi:hypothetical protein KCP69_26640 (plasmid) [Salmonella enterica subsp. enterica]|nr:hypothetical protein KCP69_26640 [Salmonella enterica subsp. enterica]
MVRCLDGELNFTTSDGSSEAVLPAFPGKTTASSLSRSITIRPSVTDVDSPRIANRGAGAGRRSVVAPVCVSPGQFASAAEDNEEFK